MRTLLAIVSFATGSAAMAGVPGNPPMISGAAAPYTFADLQMMHRYQLQQLRAEALRQQSADGGRLSPASTARLQAKLDALNTGFVRSVHNNDPY